MPTPNKANDIPASASSEQPKAPRKAPVNNISFVAFDGSSNDASKKAVRKQAALASAAARKETIAKKIAQQKVKEGEDRKKEKETTSAGAKQETSIKRKRSSDALSQRRAGPWQHGLVLDMPSIGRADTMFSVSSGSSIAQDQQEDELHVSDLLLGEATNFDRYPSPAPSGLSRQTSRIVPAYLSPPGTARNSRLPSPSYMNARPEEDAELIPRRHAWPVMADDIRALDGLFSLPMTPESLASPQSRSASITDPFNQWPVKYHPIYDQLLHHMMHIYAPRGWPALKITPVEGKRWEHFMMQLSLAEPALFLVRSLYASGDLINKGIIEPEVAVQLRSLAIKAINEALSDGDRAISDGVILAVGRIALAETLYGDKVAAQTMHRPAQRRMITLRGGMKALPFSPLVKRLMRWSDKVMSVQSGTPRLLPDDEDEGNTTFDMVQSVSVLDSWAPAAGQAMRKKIAIADLINE